jgi:hypothetical protein
VERSPRRDYFAAPAFGVASVGFCDSNSLPHAARPAPIRISMDRSTRLADFWAMAQHVRMDRKRHLGPDPDPAEQRMEGLWRHRPTALGHEHMRGWLLLAFQTP